MTMTLTFTGEWADIAREMRSVLGITQTSEGWTEPQITEREYKIHVFTDEPVSETPAPRTRRKKAEAPPKDLPLPPYAYQGAPDTDEPEAPEPVYESTVTTPLVEEPAPSVDAPVETQASTSEPGSDAPASGTATPASEVAYADVVAAVTDLASAKGPEAVKQALREMGLTTAKGTAPEVWPTIIAAMREAM